MFRFPYFGKGLRQGRFGLVMSRNVHHRPYKLLAFRFVIEGVSHNVDMLDCVVRHQQAVFKVEVRSLTFRAVECLFY